jgi:uncharacterized protein (DUF4415 family)
MEVPLIWDEAKRLANLRKHGLDFADAGEVLESRYRLDVQELREGELRVLSISYALGFLAVLTVVHTDRDGMARVISFRRASQEKERPTMSGSKTNAMKREAVLAAVRAIPPEQDFVWDGRDEDDRPASAEALQRALADQPRKRGRPLSSSTKQQVAIRFDRDVLAALRATGPGWQTRVNDVMREWVSKQAS